MSNKNIPIKINEEEVTAYVDHIQPFLMGYRVLLSLGSFPIKEYIYKLNNFYIEEQRFEIEIIDGIDFKASKYFDISINIRFFFVPKILRASLSMPLAKIISKLYQCILICPFW